MPAKTSVVGIEREKAVAPCPGEREIVTPRVARVLRTRHQDDLGERFTDHLGGAVGGGVVHDDRLHAFGGGVRTQGGEAGAEQIPGVPVNNEDAQHRANAECTVADAKGLPKASLAAIEVDRPPEL